MASSSAIDIPILQPDLEAVVPLTPKPPLPIPPSRIPDWQPPSTLLDKTISFMRESPESSAVVPMRSQSEAFMLRQELNTVRDQLAASDHASSTALEEKMRRYKTRILGEAQTQVQAQQPELDRLHGEVALLRHSGEEAKIQVLQLRAEVEKLSLEKWKAWEACDATAEEMKALEAEKSTASKRVSALREENEALRSHLKNLIDEGHAHAKVLALLDEIQQLRAGMDALSADKREVEERAHAENTTGMAEITRLHDQLEKLSVEKRLEEEHAREAHDAKLAAVLQLTAAREDMDALRATHTSAEARVRTLEVSPRMPCHLGTLLIRTNVL